ncbi:MAG: hypothetical protein M1819_002739 [Sarea resinae]|nr:MAG: hypothetical protein M1819_002739 [Sarea resinae]
MHYIRFLKPAKLVNNNNSIETLMTLTSDLGESFYAGSTDLTASLISASPLQEQSRPYLHQTYKWTPGSRTLKLAFDIRRVRIPWPARVYVTASGVSEDADTLLGDENSRTTAGCPPTISAWSSPLHPPTRLESMRLVERRFRLPSKDAAILSIWEETGESIARHIWDAGLTLTAYLSRVATGSQMPKDLQLPMLDAMLASTDRTRAINIIELGSGCGMVGISLSQLVPNASIVLTDLPEAEDILRRNMAAAKTAPTSSLALQMLDWEDEGLPEIVSKRKALDLILVADCTYNPDTTPALVRTLAALTESSHGKAIIVVAMKVRHASEAVFFDLMAEAGLAQYGHVALPSSPCQKTLANDFGEPEIIDVYVFGASKD